MCFPSAENTIKAKTMKLFYHEMCHVYKSLTCNVEKCTSATDTASPADRVSEYMTFKQVTWRPLARA